MTSQNGRAFNEWLRGQLKAKKMSQRQLAQQSGVDHSTISRLIRGDRMPSLGTATKLARGLRELRDDADTPAYLGLVASGTTNPTARVEYALRSDDLLNEPQVRQIMEYYLAVRVRRYGRAYQGGTSRSGGGGGGGGERTPEHALRPTSAVMTSVSGVNSVTSAADASVARRPFSNGVAGTGGPSATGQRTAISTIATVRPVSRTSGREPGRY
jgi:transcriptional regulator with XRE-family HTH domain